MTDSPKWTPESGGVSPSLIKKLKLMIDAAEKDGTSSPADIDAMRRRLESLAKGTYDRRSQPDGDKAGRKRIDLGTISPTPPPRPGPSNPTPAPVNSGHAPTPGGSGSTGVPPVRPGGSSQNVSSNLPTPPTPGTPSGPSPHAGTGGGGSGAPPGGWGGWFHNWFGGGGKGPGGGGQGLGGGGTGGSGKRRHYNIFQRLGRKLQRASGPMRAQGSRKSASQASSLGKKLSAFGDFFGGKGPAPVGLGAELFASGAKGLGGHTKKLLHSEDFGEIGANAFGAAAGGAKMGAGAAIMTGNPALGAGLLAMSAGLKLTGLIFQGVDALQKWNKELMAANAKFAEFSSSMAAVMARQQFRDIEFGRERGERRAASSEFLAENYSKMRDVFGPWTDRFANAKNLIAGGASNLVARGAGALLLPIEQTLQEARKHSTLLDKILRKLDGEGVVPDPTWGYMDTIMRDNWDTNWGAPPPPPTGVR